MHKPPLVERAEALGLRCDPALGRIAHLLAAERGRMRAATTVAGVAPWIASALSPGIPLFVTEFLAAEDPDVHVVDELASEAPFDLLVVTEADEETVALLMLGGIVVAEEILAHPDLAVAKLDGLALGVRVR